MKEPIRYESIQEPLDEEERELMDPESWDWENPWRRLLPTTPLSASASRSPELSTSDWHEPHAPKA